MNKKLQEKRKRIDDVLALQRPDRVPFYLVQNYLPVKDAGLTYKDAHYDLDAWTKANINFIKRYDPDLYFFLDAPILGYGPIHSILGTLPIKWPGGTLPDDYPHQFVEGEYMLQEEYDHFLDDPSDYLIRVLAPRIFSNLQGLAKLPTLKTFSFGYLSASFLGLTFSDFEVAGALQKMIEISKPALEFATKIGQAQKELLEKGQICVCASLTIPPFDLISDHMRGMRGTMIDMFQVPNKLIAAMEKLYPFLLDFALQSAQGSEDKRIYIGLHRAADGFMSLQQFERFYWPYLKQLICDIINAGFTPMPFFQGTYNTRLDYLAQLPAGKIIGWFDRTDLKLLKEKLGDVLCVAGGMPDSLLQTGSVEDIQRQTKRVIELFEKRGLIMAASSMLYEVKPELMQAWVDATREFGV